MKREIKFRAWRKDENRMVTSRQAIITALTYEIMEKNKIFELMQFTGLEDKNENNTCIYEEDIVSLHGIIIGNKYENENLLKDASNLLIEGFGTETWRITEEKAMGRGCFYPK